ncbi:pimeloyl-ACP methyl ester carboxylesterase [Lysobacter enzymogenes]|jgi:pimeloyl-ACP methyl ester carboxylesterase|uniref:alpha/beta fold hydrolase n=1 Tax=Lysobacter enzymogenes TaxID=69 RepID=UPI00089639ED|nr:alpha/beta hydrolase [Lysobacter enzymogenes]SDX62268.1 Pimeloyl-ACP methyl ester carboxylesterase [Lysobacter enzymogenes]
MQDLLLFSHANGFPAPVYRLMLEALSARYRIVRPERIGHDPRYPVTLDWPHLIEELVQRTQAAAGDARRIFLVGHSLGGYLSLLASHRLAGTALAARVAGVVMLDSPLIAGWRARLVQLGRRTGLDNLVMPTRATLQRRRHWPDRDAVRAHFLAKPAFARWDARVLEDYVEHGTRAGADGARELSFEREIEYRIYRSLPTTSLSGLTAQLRTPVGFLAGTRSRELRNAGDAATRRLVGDRWAWVEGSHLFPMERPLDTAQAIEAMLERLAPAAAETLAEPLRPTGT